MANTIDLEPCYLLHARKYTDSKRIVSLLTKNHGVISAVLREKKRKNITQAPVPFADLIVSCIGTQSLKTITSWEYGASIKKLVGEALFCGIYVNEMLDRLITEGEESIHLFDIYAQTLDDLSSVDGDRLTLEKILRVFELRLLSEIGFGLNFVSDINGVAIDKKQNVFYRYRQQQGFECVENSNLKQGELNQLFSAEDLHQISQFFWTPGSLRAAKRLVRMVIQPLLGGRPIKARELFQ